MLDRNSLAEKKLKQLADYLVKLIGDKGKEGLTEALKILGARYPHEPHKITRVYEMALLVHQRRALLNQKPKIERAINPEADWLALSASQAITRRNYKEAFMLLHQANFLGVRQPLCRSIVFQLLRNLPNPERVLAIEYTDRDLTSIEIARIRGMGLIIVKNASSQFIRTDWQDRSFVRSESKIIFRSEHELIQDANGGFIKYEKSVGRPASISYINWADYVNSLVSDANWEATEAA